MNKCVQPQDGSQDFLFFFLGGGGGGESEVIFLREMFTSSVQSGVY